MDKVAELEEKLPIVMDDVEKIDILNEIAWEVQRKDPVKALKLCTEAKALSENLRYEKGLAYAIRNMGVCNTWQSKLEPALSCSLEALEMFKTLGDKLAEAQSYISLGTIYYYLGEYEKSLESYIAAEMANETIGNKAGQSQALNGAGMVYQSLANPKKALDFLLKGHELSIEAGDKKTESYILDSIGESYISLAEYDKAYEYYVQCLKLAEETGDMRVQSYALFGMGEVFNGKDMYHEAGDYYFRSLSLRREIGYKAGEAVSLLHFGKFFLKYGDTPKAIDFLEQSLKVSEEIGIKGTIYKVHEVMAEAYEKLDDLPRFVEHFKLFHKLRSEVIKEELENKQKNLSMQFEVERLQKEAEINRLTNVVLKEKNEALEGAYKNFSVLSSMGQDITSSLNFETILNILYDNVNKLMDANIFGIGIYHADKQEIEYKMTIIDSKRLPAYSRSMADKSQFPVWCIENRKEIFINDLPNEYHHYIEDYHDRKNFGQFLGEKPQDPTSMIYLPLLVKEEVIGLISVQSFKKDAYTPYQLDMLRTLASYTAAALENASAYETLSNTYSELTQTQQQLVQADKMASLGQLTAGIAHEINNPVNFMSGSIKPLHRDIEDLIEFIRRYDEIIGDALPEDKMKELKAMKADMDIDFTMQEILTLLKGVEEGANRTSEIVKGLRNFSRLDESSWKNADLNEGIESTLLLLNNKLLEKKIHLEKNLNKIPLINCYPGQINQVLMNIIGNAIDANEVSGRITISSIADNGLVKVSIKDEGMGMTEDIKQKIFEPFFTTKEVGKGTGLGLSISYGIIDKHHGKIQVESQPGKGTEFIISLPVEQKQ